jgi:hypothetical protein
MQGGRKLSSWNLFVKKIYREGKAKDSSYEFKQALADASKRKSEMKSVTSSTSNKKSRKTKKSRKSRNSRKTRKSRKMSLALA